MENTKYEKENITVFILKSNNNLFDKIFYLLMIVKNYMLNINILSKQCYQGKDPFHQ